MAEDIATETGLVPTGSSDPTLSPSAIVGLLLEIQSSLLENPEHAHLSDAAEDLLLGLVRSIKNVEALDGCGDSHSTRPVLPPSGDTVRPQLRIVKEAEPGQTPLQEIVPGSVVLWHFPLSFLSPNCYIHVQKRGLMPSLSICWRGVEQPGSSSGS